MDLRHIFGNSVTLAQPVRCTLTLTFWKSQSMPHRVTARQCCRPACCRARSAGRYRPLRPPPPPPPRTPPLARRVRSPWKGYPEKMGRMLEMASEPETAIACLPWCSSAPCRRASRRCRPLSPVAHPVPVSGARRRPSRRRVLCGPFGAGRSALIGRPGAKGRGLHPT